MCSFSFALSEDGLCGYCSHYPTVNSREFAFFAAVKRQASLTRLRGGRKFTSSGQHYRQQYSSIPEDYQLDIARAAGGSDRAD